MSEDISSMTDMHRTRNGRLDIDQFSRGLKPKWRMIRIDGAYFDRRKLAEWLTTRGKFAPTTRRALTSREIEALQNANPYRILGKAPFFPKNRAA